MINVLSYAENYKQACLSIFMSNTPDFFSMDEIDDYQQFLEDFGHSYLLIENAGQILGCGGYALDSESGEGRLCWGMVNRNDHRKKLGTFLLVARLQQFCRLSCAKVVLIQTSQHSAGFFRKFGFTLIGVISDHFAPGLDCYKMVLELNEQNKKDIAQTWSELQQLNFPASC